MKVDMIVDNDKLIPHYKTIGSGGCDLVANIQNPMTIEAGAQALISTGIKIHIKDENVAGYIIPRSGKGTQGLVLGNLVGFIDSDFQGEMKIPLWNRSKAPITINPLDAVAQFYLAPVIRAEWNIVDSFDEKTVRGEGGFGHTDKLPKKTPTSNQRKKVAKK